MSDPNIELYGFTPVPRDPDVLFKDVPTASGDHPKQDDFTISDFPLPKSPLIDEVKAFAQVGLNSRRLSGTYKSYRQSWMLQHFTTVIEYISMVRRSLPSVTTIMFPSLRLCLSRGRLD